MVAFHDLLCPFQIARHSFDGVTLARRFMFSNEKEVLSATIKNVIHFFFRLECRLERRLEGRVF